MIVEAILISFALCADSFAVSLCCSLSGDGYKWKNIALVALAFALIHSSFLAAGWVVGDALLSLVGKLATIVAFALLLYVAGSLLYDAFSGKAKLHEFNSIKNVLLGAVATSIDAAAVGAAKSMENVPQEFLPTTIALLLITILSVVLGILGGRAIGCRYGKAAKMFGGLVLLIIAFWKLFA